MGISTCRFIDQKQIEEFKCSICRDVADNPALLEGSEDIYCQSCLEICGGRIKLPSGQRVPVSGNPVPEPWKKIDGFVKRWYLKLKIKCLNPVCDHVLNPSNYKHHDDNCPVTFKKCDDCGHKSRRGEDSSHSCSKRLEDDYNKKLILLKKEMDKKFNQTGFAMFLGVIVLIVVMAYIMGGLSWSTNGYKELRSELNRIKRQLANERDRYI